MEAQLVNTSNEAKGILLKRHRAKRPGRNFTQRILNGFAAGYSDAGRCIMRWVSI
jgi:hypothetical protein